MVDMNEIIAVMAAPIYAQLCQWHVGQFGPMTALDVQTRKHIRELAVKEAHALWYEVWNFQK